MVKKGTMLKQLSNIALSITGFIGVLCLWGLCVHFTELGQTIPGPIEVFKRFVAATYTPIGKEYTLLQHLSISLRRVLTGYGLSAVTGILLGVAMGQIGRASCRDRVSWCV